MASGMSAGCGGVPMTMPVVAPRADARPVEWRREPFRMFFPFAVWRWPCRLPPDQSDAVARTGLDAGTGSGNQAA